MALLESETFKLGTQAPAFKLLNTKDGQSLSLSELKGEKGTAIFFICNHCPYVIHINSELVKMANDYMSRSIGFIAISSNDVIKYPQDGPDKMKLVADELNYPFPYLYDETQEVAKAYHAACTPDIYLFDKDLNAFYHGQLDNSRPGNDVPSSGKDFRNAMNYLLDGKEAPHPQKPSVGCSIKWK